MSDTPRYVPIMKAKRGEVHALALLTPHLLEHITPLFEMPFASSHSDKSGEDQVLTNVMHISRKCPQGRRVLFDFGLLSPQRKLGGLDPSVYAQREWSAEGIWAVFVGGLGRSGEFNQGFRRATLAGDRGAALRLLDDDFGREDLYSDIDAWLRMIDLKPERVDLVIDLGEIEERSANRTAIALRGITMSVPYLEQWRSFTVASTSFPNTSSIATNPNLGSATRRADWDAYRSLMKGPSKPIRLPDFGDYAVSTPELVDFNPRLMQPGETLRYTTDTEYIIIKGGGFRSHGGEMFRQICEVFVERPEFEAGASWADRKIEAIANGEDSSGNPETWRRIATNRHLTVATRGVTKMVTPPSQGGGFGPHDPLPF